MISRHRDREGVSVRTPDGVRGAALAALESHDWTLAQFLIACLLAVADKPEQTLGLLSDYQPPQKTKGRPRKDNAGE